MFNPKTEYDIVKKTFPIKDFHEYADEFVIRPPYQRKNVWSRKKQQSLLDSLFRRYYVPRLVLREVRLDDDRTVSEVIDGQQRIHTVQKFIAGELSLPKSLSDIDSDLAGAYYSDLSPTVRRFINREINYDADIVKNVNNPRDPNHQKIATEIFWRLQQGESLNFMEVAHSRLSSLARNFVVKYGDDIRFDYEKYQPIDRNPNKHNFFTIIGRNNNRMQHLALLTRFLILETNDGAGDIRDVNVIEFINSTQSPDGIGNWSYENEPPAQKVLKTLRVFYDIFSDDPMVDDNNGMKEFHVEYFIVSVYLLLRHLLKYYVFDKDEKKLFYNFVLAFYKRWRSKQDDDADILIFSDNRQQSENDIETRGRIMRQLFFEYANENGVKILTKDERRSFSEDDKIIIYRMDSGICQMCLEEGKPEKEAKVSWSEYQADHVIPHSKGGQTVLNNAQVLCRYHNQVKSNK